MENEQTLDDIWERANLELDYQKITAKKGTRGPQKMDKKTLWSKKVMEHLYNLLTSTNTGNWSVDHGFIQCASTSDRYAYRIPCRCATGKSVTKVRISNFYGYILEKKIKTSPRGVMIKAMARKCAKKSRTLV